MTLHPIFAAASLLLAAFALSACEQGPARSKSRAPSGLFGNADPLTERNRGDQKGGRVDDDGEDGEEAAARLDEAEFFEGTGRFTGDPRPRVDVAEREQGYTLNFAQAGVREVVDAVLGDALGYNYTIDPEVQGTITARTANPLPEDKVVPALEDILAMNNLALLNSGGIYRVMPMEAAGMVAPVSPGKTPKGHGFGLHVISLDYASADAMAETLSPFVAPGRDLQADAGRNLLLFRGPSPEARDLMGIADLFDVDWLAGMSFALLPLNSADASEVSIELETIFGQGEAGPPAMKGVVRFMPVERMNAVLVISEQPAYLKYAEVWARRLDRGGSEEERTLYVYHVRNARADDIAAVLGQLFDVRTVGAEQRGAEVGLGRSSGTLFGSTGGFGNEGGGGSRGGTPVPQAGARTSSGEGSTGRSGAFGEGLRGLSRPSGGGSQAGGRGRGAFGENGPRIIADARNDALLILATAKEYRMIESTIKRLDLVPLQVLIEATIAEVTLNDTLNYGLRWFFEEDSGDETSSFQFSDLSDGALSPSFPGFSYIFDAADARVVLSALSQITDVNVVSSPQLMVLDNGVARLQVGDQVPVPVQQAVSVQDPDAPVVNSVRFEDTGVILEVTPHVNSTGLVVLDVRQEVSDVVETLSSGIDAPTIQQRQIESSVAVQTGETIALGGLIRDQRTIGVTGVPFLKDIPILGNLFKSQSRTQERTELLVLLTPHVVRDSQESRAVTNELRRRLRGLEQLRESFRYEVEDLPEEVTEPEIAEPAPPQS